MMSSFIKNLLLELCLDPRIEDGMFSVDKKDHIEILREYLYDADFSTEFVSEYIDNLIEGKYPERQAYTVTGYLATFDTIQGKKEALGAGSHFDKNPVHKRKEPTHKDKEKDEDESNSPKKDVKIKEKDTEKEEAPEKKKDSDDKEETKKKSTKKSDSKDKKKDEDEEDKGETSTLNFGKAEEKETPEEEKPRKEEWKETPDDTRRRAESLGWEKDTSGNWYCDTDFVGITSDDGYVVPIKDGDKNSPTEWPTHICGKKEEKEEK